MREIKFRAWGGNTMHNNVGYMNGLRHATVTTEFDFGEMTAHARLLDY